MSKYETCSEANMAWLRCDRDDKCSNTAVYKAGLACDGATHVLRACPVVGTSDMRYACVLKTTASEQPTYVGYAGKSRAMHFGKK